MQIGIYDTKAIEKEYKKLNSPEKYDIIDINEMLTNDYNMYLSTRNDGKTTDALLKGLILFKLYGVLPIYNRNDTQQITLANVSNLFETIKNFNYIDVLFEGEWNDVIYINRERKFYLAFRNRLTGDIEQKDDQPCCYVTSCENWKNYKSTVNLPTAWYIIWDEFLDTNRFASPIVSEMMNNISTFTRSNANAHVVALSNTINPYSVIFEDFAITDDVAFMEFGDKKNIKSVLGTTFYIELLRLSKEKKKNLIDKTVRFFGINNKKFANFTGIQAWQGREYRHLMEKPISQEPIYFIKHREKYITVYFCELENKRPVYLVTKCSFIPDGRGFVITNEPQLSYEIAFNPLWCNGLVQAAHENRICVSTNEIGLLFDDFLQTNRVKWG